MPFQKKYKRKQNDYWDAKIYQFFECQILLFILRKLLFWEVVVSIDLFCSRIVHFRGAEIVETTLVITQFCFLRVGSHLSQLRVIILPEMQILKVGSRISDLSQFHFSFLNFYVAPSHFKKNQHTAAGVFILI